MKKVNFKAIKEFFNSRRNITIIYSILTVITGYYLIITGVYLLFLIPLVVTWLLGAEGVKFFNVYDSREIQRTDISYFTTGDIIDSIKLFLIIAVLVLFIVKLRKLEKKLV